MPNLDPIAIATWTAELGPILDVPDDADRLAIEADIPCEAAVTHFGAALDRAYDADPQKLSETLRADDNRPLVGAVLSRMSLARQVRVVTWIIDAGVPNAQALIRTLAKPGEDGTGETIRESMVVLHRQKLLGRLFARDRLAALLDACRITEEELL